MTQSSPQRPTNINTELARERNRAAAERTLMAWIRTCLALISFGFGLDRIVAAIAKNNQETLDPIHLSRLLGLSFIALGTIAMLLAAIEHRYILKRIIRDDYLYQTRISLSFAVSLALVIIGLASFVGVIVNALN
ncbi:MAG: YidH family protein [Microcystaceae cyanobacterium]